MQLAIFAFTYFAVQFCSAALWVEPPNPKAGPNQCISENEAIGTLKYDENKLLPDCSKATCNSGGSITHETCGSVQIPDGCVPKTLPEKKPYPACCDVQFDC